MKKTNALRALPPVLLVAALLITLFVRAVDPMYPKTSSQQGIRFFSGTWAELLAEAKRQHKPIFFDVYTTWCGPCKQMEKQAFPDKGVGELLNANFVSYRLDAEKGEGIALAKRYAVSAYPTLLFLDSDGRLIHRHVGYNDVPDFLTSVRLGISALLSGRPISAWDADFNAGKRDAAFLKTYLQKRADLELPNGNALTAYLNQLPEAEWTSEDNLLLVAGNLTTARSKAFDMAVLEVDSVSPNRESANRNGRVIAGLNRALAMDREAATTEAELAKSIQNARRIAAQTAHGPNPTEWWQTDLETAQWLHFYQRTNNPAKYREAITRRVNAILAIPAQTLAAMNVGFYQQFLRSTATVPDSIKKTAAFKRAAVLSKSGELTQRASRLNTLCRNYANYLTSPTDLAQALTWSGRALRVDRNPGFLDMHAQLLAKLGRRDEAITHMEEAIALFRKYNQQEEARDFEKTLAQLKK